MSQRRFTTWVRDFGAGAVALAAIGLAVWEGWENRVHNRLSVVPKLDGTRDFDMLEQRFSLNMISSGLGPAVVRDSWLYVDGKRIFASSQDGEFPWRGAYELFPSGFDVIDDYFGAGHYMTPGNKYRFLEVVKRAETPRDAGFRDVANRIDIVTCYCSVYGDSCRIEHIGLNAVAAPECDD